MTQFFETQTIKTTKGTIPQSFVVAGQWRARWHGVAARQTRLCSRSQVGQVSGSDYLHSVSGCLHLGNYKVCTHTPNFDKQNYT